MEALTTYNCGIHAVDANYVRPMMASIHLVVENGRVAIIDTGNNESLIGVLASLAGLGLTADQVDYVILTHVHLDHAGGAGAMMKAFPNARLVVHPRGARHMADPSKLVAGATAVYGPAEMRRLYGEVVPIDASRIVEATNGFLLNLAGRELQCLDTPGHARHHICLYDSKSGHIFVGDTFGLSYRELDTDGRQFIFPTTSPVQFDPDAMHASLDLLMSYRPEAVYLTHYSQVRDVAAKARDLHRLIDAHLAVARFESAAGPERHARIRAGLAHLLVDEAKSFGCLLQPAEILRIHAADLDLNAQGLGVWLDSRG